MMDAPRISVLLLTKNAGERFTQVLDALFACSGIEEAEVVMVDSGSTDGTVERARRYPGVRLHALPPEEFGHGKTRNLAASLARGELLVYLVQDAVPRDPELLHHLLAPFGDDPRVAATFARQVAREDANPVERFFLRSTYPELRQVRQADEEGPVKIRSIFFSNVCSAIRREVWEQHPFAQDLIMSEDQLWAREALAAGHRIVYEPQAVVIHSHNYRLRDLFRRNFDSGYSLIGITDDSCLDMARYELGHLAAGARELLRNGQGSWVPFFLLYELVRALGFVCGRRARWLPLPLRRTLSAHRSYWNRPAPKESAPKE